MGLTALLVLGAHDQRDGGRLAADREHERPDGLRAHSEGRTGLGREQLDRLGHAQPVSGADDEAVRVEHRLAAIGDQTARDVGAGVVEDVVGDRVRQRQVARPVALGHGGLGAHEHLARAHAAHGQPHLEDISIEDLLGLDLGAHAAEGREGGGVRARARRAGGGGWRSEAGGGGGGVAEARCV